MLSPTDDARDEHAALVLLQERMQKVAEAGRWGRRRRWAAVGATLSDCCRLPRTGNDIVQRIFTMLPYKDASALRCTCRDMRRATKREGFVCLWRKSADEEPVTGAPYFAYFGSGPGHELDAYMALCGTLIYVKGKTAKRAVSYRLYGEHDWEYREHALKSDAAREQGYRTLLAFSGEGALRGGTTFRPLGNQTFEIIMLRATAMGKGVGGAIIGKLQADLVAEHGERAVLLAEAVEGPARDKMKVARFFSERCGFQRSEEAERILDRCYLEKERRFYGDQGVDLDDARAVDDARCEWTQPWTGEEEADRRRAQLTFSWNTCRAPYKMIWRATMDDESVRACL